MTLVYRHRPIGDSWPGPRTRTPGKSPFGANWGDTLQLLEKEIRALSGKGVVLAVECGERDIRLDGGIRADARLRNPAVIVEFHVGPDLLSFPCDRFHHWQDNVRAIALALEALRKVDRYGVRSGRQYEGYKRLPGAGATSETMDAARAALVLDEITEVGNPEEILKDVEIARVAVRLAALRTHPDRNNGSTEAFQLVQSAKQVLAAHHGATL